MVVQERLEFWSARAGLGPAAGTNDIVLKQIEMDLLLRRVPVGASVLDVGCGNGWTLVTLARQRGITGCGIDFCSSMIEEASRLAAGSGLSHALRFAQAEATDLPEDIGVFDVAITERCLINLPDEDTQRRAFLQIMRHVRPGGVYLMIESCTQGLDRTNEVRATLDLPPIEPPWHNNFLDADRVARWGTYDTVLEEVLPFTSTYHFLSRVVYAALARDRGEELRYDSDINLLAARLPVVGDFGPVRLWVWRRRSANGREAHP